jgi:hypothetical protein
MSGTALKFIRFQLDMLRLRIVEKLLPPGYSIWTWGEDSYDLLDQPLVAKPLRKDETYV